MKTTVSYTYILAQEVIASAAAALSRQVRTDLTADVIAFEDGMNGLSGAIANLDPQLQLQLQKQCGVLVDGFAAAGYEVRLWKSLLPPVSAKESGESYTSLAKKLYPLTVSTLIVPHETISESNGANVSSDTVTVNTEIAVTLTGDGVVEEVIDPVFDELDAEPVTDEPLATIQNETAAYLSNSLIEIAKTAAAYSELQDGLVEFSHNPLEDLIRTTKDLFIYYTEGNYANLNTALSVVYADAGLASQYKELRESIGGPDGLAGCVSQMDFLLEHTNRLSGLVLDVDSPNDVTDNDSTDEYVYVNDVATVNTPTVIFSFDSRYFRSASYTIQATAAALDRGHQVTNLVILHDNHHSYTRETATVYSQNPFVTFTSRILNNRVEVLANTSASNTDFVIHGVRLRIARASKTYGEMSQQKIIQQHELLQAYLDDGVDYVAAQSGSLLRGDLVKELSRLFSDMLITFSNAGFLSQSEANKQAQLVAMAANIKAHRAAIQAQMDKDYDTFVAVRKLTEALDIAYNLSVSYTDSTGNAIPSVTLNNATINAINEQPE